MPTPPITPTLTLTPPPLTSTPTPTPAQVEDETATLALSLTADPPWAAPGEVVTFTVTAASPALAAAVTAAALLAIVSPRNNETWATTEQGGWLRSADDRLLLRVPPGAVKGRAHFRYAPAGDLAQPLAGLRHAFTVEAQAEDGTTQHEFAYWPPFIQGTQLPTWRLNGVAYTEACNSGVCHFREAPAWWLANPAGHDGALDAYAPDGTRYHFEPALYDWYDNGASDRIDKWVLQYIRDLQGNQIDYVYDSALPVDPTDVANHHGNYVDALGPRYRYFAGGSFGVYYLNQINLTQMRYNGGQTVVDFAYTARDDASVCDQQNSLQDPGPDADEWAHFTTRLLTGIRVRQSGQLVAGYRLTYDHWDGTVCADWRRYALQTIARCSDEGLTDCLPPTTFTNTPQESENNGMVTRYDNGYGGRVDFTYAWDVVAFTNALATRTVTDQVTGQSESWNYGYASPIVGAFLEATEILPASLGSGNTIYHRFLPGNLAADATKVGVKVVEEAAGSAAKQAGRQISQEIVEQAIKSKIEPARDLLRQRIPDTEVHHLIEQRFATQFGIKPGDILSVRLDKTFHQQEVISRLFSKGNLPTGGSYSPQDIWNAYQKVYGADGLNRLDWLETVWPYFEKLGVVQ